MDKTRNSRIQRTIAPWAGGTSGGGEESNGRGMWVMGPVCLAVVCFLALGASWVPLVAAQAEDRWTERNPGLRRLHRTTTLTNARGRGARSCTVHALVADLTAEGVSVETTRREERWRSVTTVGRERNAAAVTNGGFWNGFAQPMGVAAGGGATWPGISDDEEHGFFAVNSDGRAFISPPEQVVEGFREVREAVSGRPMLVRGSSVDQAGLEELEWARHRHPRTAIGVSRDGNTVFLVVVDGRQEHSSGMTLFELAELFVELGAHEAINLDGGGSSAMYLREFGGVANSPSGGRWEQLLGMGAEEANKRRVSSGGGEEAYVRGVEREVLNHVIVFAPAPRSAEMGSDFDDLPMAEAPYALPPREPLLSLGQSRELIYPAVLVGVPLVCLVLMVALVRRRRRRMATDARDRSVPLKAGNRSNGRLRSLESVRVIPLDQKSD